MCVIFVSAWKDTIFERLMEKDFSFSSTSEPLYLQLFDQVVSKIEEGELRKGDKLPSVNDLYQKLEVSRVTIVNAYDRLKNSGVIESRPGKGYYVIREEGLRQKRVFLLFDAMNSYKEILYRSFVDALGPNYAVEIFFHYYNMHQFERLINNHLGAYDHYVILPHFNVDTSEVLGVIPSSKLILMDKDVPELKAVCARVFQNFHSDVFKELSRATDLLRKYKQINLILQKRFQFIPQGIITGFEKFCQVNNLRYQLVEDLRMDDIVVGEAYFVISDKDLVKVFQYCTEGDYALGQDIGLLSYDDTPLKTVLGGGVTVLSTDFEHMGKTAAQMIKDGQKTVVDNPAQLIVRRTL